MSSTLVAPVQVNQADLDLELARFLSIAGERTAAGQEPPQMFSPLIDQAWHNRLQDAPAYEAFAVEHAGRPVRHLPVRGSGTVNWVGDYEERFGTLPDTWFMAGDGTLDVELHREYHDTGRITTAEWDCTPDTGDDGDGAAPGTTW